MDDKARTIVLYNIMRSIEVGIPDPARRVYTRMRDVTVGIGF